MLAFIAAAALSGDISWDLAIEQRVAALEKEVAALKAQCSACQCGPSAKTPVAATGSIQGYIATQDALRAGCVLGWREGLGDTRAPTKPLRIVPATKCTVDNVPKTVAEFSALDHKGSYFVAKLDANGNAAEMHTFPSWATPNTPSSYSLAPSVKSNDAPTFHYAPGTTYRIEDGAVILSAPANAVSYPGGPMFQPIQQGGCPDGSCGRSRGRRR